MPTLAGKARRRLSQQLEAFDAGEAHVGIGVVLSDIAHPGRTEHRVAQRVGDGIAIGMSDEAPFALEAHTTEHERSVITLFREGMEVDPQTDAYLTHVERVASVRTSARYRSNSATSS